ncbi:MAG: dTDP-glucose 4,6-dehydratase [Candidatus Aminicenantes bacterium]
MRTLAGKTMLVTGGCGFIGSNFIHYWLDTYPDSRIINLDKLTYAGNPDNLRDIENDSRYTFVHGDIRNPKLVKTLMREADMVVHLAAETHVDRSIINAGDFVMTDVYGSFVLFEALRHSEVEIFLHVSTDEVYGSRAEGLFKESDPVNPSSPYAASKAGADRMAHAYVVTYGLPIIITRPSNNYGPFQYPEKFIPLFITNALEKHALPLYGKGENVRDWLFVTDHCRAMEAILLKGEFGGVYNIGGNCEVKNIDTARKILELLNEPDNLITFVSDRPGHDIRYALDCEKIRALDWVPQTSFDGGMAETVRWYRNNIAWWRKIKNRSEEFRSYYQEQYKNRK